MRKKLIELIGQVQDCGCDVTDVVEMNYVENITLADHLIENGVVISNSETTTKWIPVTERLPEDRKRVLCFGGANGWKWTKIARFTTCLEDYDKYDFEGQKRHGFFNYDSEYGDYEETDVTHWMPLPEPPKGE